MVILIMAIEIYTLADLNAIRNDLTAEYILMNDIDASPTSTWNSGLGWEQIGRSQWNHQFRGKIYGNNKKIIGLYINRLSESYVGFISTIRADAVSLIQDIRFENCTAIGLQRVGIIAGQQGAGANILRCAVSGNVSGGYASGGIVGTNAGNIIDCYSRVATNMSHTANGGIAGENSGVINRCYFAGTTNGSVARNGVAPAAGTITNTFWDSIVSGTTSGGGTPKTTAEMKNVRTYTDPSWSTGLTSAWDFLNNPYSDSATNDYWNIATGYNNGYPFFTYEFTPVSGSTRSAINITQNSATIRGELIDPAGNAVNLFFRYRQVGAGFWAPEIQKQQNVTLPLEFSHSLTGLNALTNYEFQAIFRWGTSEILGEILTFTTSAPLSLPVVQTNIATTVLETSAQLNGTLVSLGDIPSVNVYFEYYKGSDPWSEILVASNVTAVNIFSHQLNNLLTNTLYYFRFKVTWNSGTNTVVGNTLSFFTSASPSVYFLRNGFEIPDGKALYFGDENTNNSFRIIRNEITHNLEFQKRINETWITQ